ncbi:MAG: hypothetical protein PHF25_07165 [Candidatus Margulisbacteria bacterium]|nr:hypothetical protein [Candidatus Margulisiibacteriota bacterium]
MDLANINANIPLDSSQTENDSFYGVTNPSTSTKTSSINTSFNPTLDNELSDEMQQDVEYKPSQNIVQEKTVLLSFQEQERMQKVQQKELLINLQKNTNTSGSSYSRNLDDAAVMNTQKKDFGKNLNFQEDSNPNLQTNDYLEDKLYIDSAAEEFNEEFLNPQKKNKTNDPESAFKNYEEKKKQQDNEDNQQKKNHYDFEDDEVVDIDSTLLSSTLNKGKVARNNQNKDNSNAQYEQIKHNPALEKALRKDDPKSNINKLRQKFNKK